MLADVVRVAADRALVDDEVVRAPADLDAVAVVLDDGERADVARAPGAEVDGVVSAGRGRGVGDVLVEGHADRSQVDGATADPRLVDERHRAGLYGHGYGGGGAGGAGERGGGGQRGQRRPQRT
jgi:hypothetical protein